MNLSKTRCLVLVSVMVSLVCMIGLSGCATTADLNDVRQNTQIANEKADNALNQIESNKANVQEAQTFATDAGDKARQAGQSAQISEEAAGRSEAAAEKSEAAAKEAKAMYQKVVELYENMMSK